MMYLWPQSSTMKGFHEDFGVMTSPRQGCVPLGVQEGRKWAMDNNAFTDEGFNPVAMERALKRMEPYRGTCLFVAIPDVVADAAATIREWNRWSSHEMFRGWPLAFVAQDGIKVGDTHLYVGSDQDFTDWVGDKGLDVEDDVAYWEAMLAWRWCVGFDEFQWLFVGGTTDWKLGTDVTHILAIMRRWLTPVHVGRVNSIKRMVRFAREGVKTVDGTFPTYEPDVAKRRLTNGLIQIKQQGRLL